MTSSDRHRLGRTEQPAGRRLSAAARVLVAGTALAALGAGMVEVPVAATEKVATVRQPVVATSIIGASVRGRGLTAVRIGDPRATRTLLVLGQMHGNEPAGRYIVTAMRSARVPTGVQIWLVSTLNPDGSVANTRRNARAVDLNRNFPYGWRSDFSSRLYYPGQYAASEPETRAFIALVARVKPDAIVSFHQAFNAVDDSNPKTARWARSIAKQIGLPVTRVSCRGKCAGTMTSWFNARYPGWALTVELPRRVSPAMQRRTTAALLRTAVALTPHPMVPPKPNPPPKPTPPAPPTPIPTATLTPVPTSPSPTETPDPQPARP